TRVPRPVDLAHPARAQWSEDLVGPETGPRCERHCWVKPNAERLAGARIVSVAGLVQRAVVDTRKPRPVEPVAAEDAHLADPGGHDAVAELHPEAARGHDVLLDRAAAPGAARDREADRREALAVEPAAGDREGGVLVDAHRVDGVLGGHE